MKAHVLWALFCVAIPSSVAAQESEPESEPAPEEDNPNRLKWEGIWSLYGVSVARHGEGDDNGYAIGIELSDVHLYRNQLWYGYYADLRYSSLARGVDLSVGMEAGVSVFGVEAGLYARVGGESAIGVRARGCFSAAAVVSICVGGGITNRGRFFEGGLLLKYGRRRSHSEPDPDPEARDDDEAPPRAIELPVADERMFILEAPFQEGVDPTEPSGEAENEAAAENGAMPSDGVAAEDEAASDVLDSEPRPSPEIVEPTEIDAVEQR